jgi:Zn-dependent protease
MDFNQIFQTVLIYALPVVLSITLHEAAHGYAAYRLGDDTAWRLGRVTLNPLAHIDPIGTILLPLMLYFSTGGSFLFGYAKPVPVRFGALNNPRRDMIWVALAGPMANLIQALFWAIVFMALALSGVQEEFFLKMAKGGVLVNVVMFAFNLFPIPPLDGGRIVTGLLPYQQAAAFSRIEPFGFFIVMALVIGQVINTFWMIPIMNMTYGLLDLLVSPLRLLFGA